ncbi:hypothetical protein A9404_00315 [Halothiobacillus diazotrophicus]|uniref:Uncharacterized protein n=1 Tax=Halothiobacillus diazotrophicus TaxID=1860122 RepID=A0A191ZDT5_9GAMM|nr:hypothetical protein [Halothiobacillus diazotrophicus]ANJ66029.1 hypothetical protein A9404_00315 [Halothiobacillus diazotrophicus]
MIEKNSGLSPIVQFFYWVGVMGFINQKISKHSLKHLKWLLLPIGAAAFYYYLWVWNPLPSDEEMIRNFKDHRADFVEVVRRYREYPRPPGTSSAFWYKEGDTLELFKRAGIDSVARSAPLWLPNPYTLETARRELSLLSSPQELHAALYRYSPLRIKPATTPRIDHPDQSDDRSYRRNTLLFGMIWKDYIFFPEIPRIENGKLLEPLQIVGKGFDDAKFHETEGVFTRQTTNRALPSLNYLPSHWKGFECVYRQIEPQWFIRMCNGH